MAITAGGVGSGLDVEGIVSQLMYLERAPVFKLEAQNKTFETELSAYGKLKSAFSSFESAMDGLGSLDKFTIYSSTSSDTDVLTASTTSNAAQGVFNVDITRLAQNHKLGSSQTDEADTFSGNLAVTVDGNTLTVDTTGLTLSQIRDAINSDADNPGLTASIINVGSGGQRLTLTADDSGQAASISVDETAVNNVTQAITGSALGLSTINTDENGALITTAELDAQFSVDGYAVTSSSNAVSDVIDGITFNLKSTGSSTLTLGRDDEAITESVNSFVDAYNDLWKTLSTLEKGDLAGDSSIRSLRNTLRNVFTQAPTGLTGSYTALIQVGVNSDARTGELSLDAEDLKAAMANDFSGVAELFADNDQGVAYRLKDLANQLQDPGNVIDSRQEGLRSRIRYNEDQVLSWDARLELKEKAMRAKFASLDALIGSLQSTSAFLASNLG